MAALPWATRAHEEAATAASSRWDDLVVVCMVLSLLLYAVGWWRLLHRSGPARTVWLARGAAFAAGWAALALALLSPLDSLGARRFSAHMLQHELLIMVAAPLLVAGTPLGAWAWALSLRARRGAGALLHRAAWRAVWRVLCRPTVAWALHALALWAWHVPALFESALHDATWHAAQHTSFLATALLYWWTVLGARRRETQGLAVLSLFLTMMHGTALGALLALSTRPWYPAYAAAAGSNAAALADQQLGGLLMWGPAGVVYLVVALALALRWGGLTEPAGRPAAAGSVRTGSSA